jgi:hypothetical protein
MEIENPSKQSEVEENQPGRRPSPAKQPPAKRGAGLSLLSILLTILAAALVVLAGLLGLRRAGLVGELPVIGQLEAAFRPERASPPAAIQPASAAVETEAQDEGLDLGLSPLETGVIPVQAGIPRRVNLDTYIPREARTEVITYTVESGDNLFAIADSFGLKPETLLWGNFEVLQDNPHILSKDQVLNILPIDGVYYQWQNGDTLDAVAAKFGVDRWAIAEYMGNNIDLTAVDEANSGLEPGTWIIVVGGSRPIKDWGPPAITRSNPASARYYGEGHCGSVYEGAIGAGAFVWPTTDHSISGYTYNPGVHPAIDIGGAIGNAVFASDSGVVVFAGWSNFGYGYMIVIDHGNGWQTAYAHLSAVGVTCGQSVFQGGGIGAVGSTGNSSGPHLHFEMVFNGAKLNPLDYIQ